MVMDDEKARIRRAEDYLKRVCCGDALSIDDALYAESRFFRALGVVQGEIVFNKEKPRINTEIVVRSSDGDRAITLKAPLMFSVPDARVNGHETHGIEYDARRGFRDACQDVGTFFDGYGIEPSDVALWSSTKRSVNVIDKCQIIVLRIWDNAFPRTPMDMDGFSDLEKHIGMLREVNKKTLIGVEINMRNLCRGVRVCVEAGADFLVINSEQLALTAGSVGKKEIERNQSVNAAIHALIAVNKCVQGLGKKIPVILRGNLITGTEVFKTLALGADIVSITHAHVMALNQILCEEKGKRAGKDKLYDTAYNILINYYRALCGEIASLLSYTNHNSPQELSKDDLVSYDYSVSAITGVKLAGYNKPLPMWMH